MAGATQVTSPSESSAAGIVETEDLIGIGEESMAGTPNKREMIRAINEAGGEGPLIARIESGETVAAIAAGFGVSRSQLSSWLNRTDETKKRVMRARETASHALAEETLKIADGATNTDDRAKRLAISARQWLAGRWNRPEYGDSPLVALQFNVGELSLEALKQPPPPVPAHLIVEADDDERGHSADTLIEAAQ